MLIRSPQVVLPTGIQPAEIEIADGRIAAIRSLTIGQAGDAPHVIMPGLVDTHVHVNDPGRSEWEGFETATAAAAAGGVTTIVDMPLNSIPATTSVAALEEKRAAARGRCSVDVEFWGGLVPGNAGEIEGMAAAGVRGFKCFLSPSGVDEFGAVDEAGLREAMPMVARTGLPLLVHAEWPSALRAADPGADGRRHASWLASRPEEAEVAAIDLMIGLARTFGVHVHIVHLAAASAIPMLQAARASGAPISVETCPHYLTFAAEEIPDGETSFKCAPPIRSAANRERLWQAVADGAIDLIASDHSPCPPALKPRGDFFAAWGGIASLEVALAAVWTGARSRGHDAADVARWMASAPARLAGLPAKGSIHVGADADLVVWVPDAPFTVEAVRLAQRHKLTPYDGRQLFGHVIETWSRGRLVYRGETP